MMLFPHRAPAPKAYRFAARVTGRVLPPVDKALRLRCTLSAADHSVVGVSAVVVHLGTAEDCDHALELVHEPAAHDAAPPKYFELIASVAPTAEPTTRLSGIFTTNASTDGTEYRIAGMMDPGQNRVVLPEIILRGQ
ncbi:MAG: hypothetical protein JO225_05315 [Candidatus Eremiobacteraeota bacterium]|nr:hypothetical protein [Candidatus Eremiobacteraeota bacterium]MBV8643317.1 hypothetical protein [Candidatus Eremiobacteraeota bacterium]